MLRRPKAQVTQSKYSEGKGSFSPSHWAAGIMKPWSIRRSRPRTSMALLMSVSQTWPLLLPPPATRLAKASERSAVPPATSSTRSPARTPETSMAKAFHRRCRPSDMRSFIRSYLSATESKTPATRFAFSPSATSLKPKWVVLSVMFSPSRAD